MDDLVFISVKHFPYLESASVFQFRAINPCAAFHIWVQFENNAVSSRYINTASGPMVKSATPIYETRGPKGSLKVLHQPSIDEHTLQQMVMPADFSMEMQNLMISELPEISGKNGGKTKQACFLCNGTGRREVAEKFVYGDNAINEEKERIKKEHFSVFS